MQMYLRCGKYNEIVMLFEMEVTWPAVAWRSTKVALRMTSSS